MRVHTKRRTHFSGFMRHKWTTMNKGALKNFMFQRNSKAVGLFTSKNILIYLKLTNMYSFGGKWETKRRFAPQVWLLCVAQCVWWETSSKREERLMIKSFSTKDLLKINRAALHLKERSVSHPIITFTRSVSTTNILNKESLLWATSPVCLWCWCCPDEHLHFRPKLTISL